ncbi:helix-turn-helix domain-containing protein [Desulfosarcina sp. OttesenSCG-928-G10]|nr:helix-turn-helix domain-containing protein [Desulfosarcina sp. OttesenSCG-928-G10]
MSRKKMHYLHSLARGLSVIQAFTAERPKLNLSELSRMTGLNVMAVQRITDTLMQMGFLLRTPHREFMLGPKVLNLGFAFLNGSQLKMLSESYLPDFSEKNHCTTNVAVLDGDMVIFLYRHESQRFLNYKLQAGSRLPAYCTATGKVLLAALSDPVLEQTLAGMKMEAVTRFTLTDPAALMADLKTIRDQGYAISDRELSLALFSFGVPVLDHEHQVVAALNLSIPVDVEADKKDAMVEGLKGLGQTFSHAMGYAGPYPTIPANAWTPPGMDAADQ